LVYCTKCGTKNSDDAVVCINCGERLETMRAYAERPRRYKYEREEMCFGPRTGAYWGIFFGFIIVLVGVIWFLNEGLIKPQYGIEIPIFPLIVIAFGIMILIGVLTRPRR